ncbi:hypothetical protein HNP82_003574 [Catenibacillus scindens]|uniref:Uncharacterized protein n=1 Tax=Catenibacillus scindens TaxID=673271 RepID=A0A7W8HDJ2_9FIRM|nr:hypothetical protein [Catenibacillus scindens]MBB5266417.1 hypothetical protein [Catenibacillus scindens]
MKTNETIKWQEEQALQRYQLIAPLLDGSLDNAKRIQLRETIAELYEYSAVAEPPNLLE